MSKIGRNAPCPCGSGKKHKHCCLDPTVALANKFNTVLENFYKDKKQARIKQCIYPNKKECRGKVVKAHAIQNNKVLSKLAVNGMLRTMDGTSNVFFQGSQSKGRTATTTFTGFCEYHDKTIFQEIEDNDFKASPSQLFLYAYRTFAWHYHKKLEQLNRNILLKEIAISHECPYMANQNNAVNEYVKELQMCSKDNRVKLERFNHCLLNKEFENIKSCIWEVPYEIQFAISTMLEVEYDVKGNQINDINSTEPLKSSYLNIFPDKNRSFCIWSWFEEDNIYNSLTQQFIQLSILDRGNYLNNNLPRWSDSLIISPRLWDKWGEGIQQALIAHANFDVIFRRYEDEDNKHAYEYMDTPWDLFEQLKI